MPKRQKQAGSVGRVPKNVLIELPTADEIDDLALTAPDFGVRKIELDLIRSKADLDYVPCKGQAVAVVRGPKGLLLRRTPDSDRWGLPTDRILTSEEILGAARRTVSEQTGVGVRSYELAGIYDVVWHHLDVTIKRLHFVYAGLTDDSEARKTGPDGEVLAKFFDEPPPELERDEVAKAALADCSAKLLYGV